LFPRKLSLYTPIGRAFALDEDTRTGS